MTDPAIPARPSRTRRARATAVRWVAVGRSVVFGLAALACTIAGVWLLAGVAWALLAAVPFLLVLDARTPPPAPRDPGAP